MRREDDGRCGLRWRAIPEARWRIRSAEVTGLSAAHLAAAADPLSGIVPGRPAAGGLGRCEQCGGLILETVPAAAGPVATGAAAGRR